MTVGESIATPSFRRMPYNHTHCAVALTAPLYSASAEERKIVCYFLLEQDMGPLEILNAKPEVEFLLMKSPTQSESVNPTSSSGELAA